MARNCRQHLGAMSSLWQTAIKRTASVLQLQRTEFASNCMILTEDLEFQKDTHPSESLISVLDTLSREPGLAMARLDLRSCEIINVLFFWLCHMAMWILNLCTAGIGSLRS